MGIFALKLVTTIIVINTMTRVCDGFLLYIDTLTFLFTLFVFVSNPGQYIGYWQRYYTEQKLNHLHLLLSLLFLSLCPCLVYVGSLLSSYRMCRLEIKLKWWYLYFHCFYDFIDCFSICIKHIHIMHPILLWLK